MAGRRQATNNVDPDLYRHMVSIDHNDVIINPGFHKHIYEQHMRGYYLLQSFRIISSTLVKLIWRYKPEPARC